MDQENIRKIQSLGVLITEEGMNILKDLSDDKLNVIIEKIKKENPFFIDKTFLKDFLIEKIEIKELKEDEREISIDEFVEILNFYYDVLSEKIKRKINPLRLTSLKYVNKGYFAVIVFVRSKKIKDKTIKLEVEDKTTAKEFVVDRKYEKILENVEENDIIGIEGKIEENGKIEIEKIVFPEIECLNNSFDEEIKLYVRNDENSFRISINGKIYTILNSSIVKINEFPILFVLNEKIRNPKDIILKSSLKPGFITKNKLINEKIGFIVINASESFRMEENNCKIFGLKKKDELRINLKTLKEEI